MVDWELHLSTVNGDDIQWRVLGLTDSLEMIAVHQPIREARTYWAVRPISPSAGLIQPAASVTCAAHSSMNEWAVCHSWRHVSTVEVVSVPSASVCGTLGEADFCSRLEGAVLLTM